MEKRKEMTDEYKIPSEITTSNPKELIAYNIALAIQTGILPKGFNLPPDGYKILGNAVGSVWGNNDMITQIILAFTAGYALGTGQVQVK